MRYIIFLCTLFASCFYHVDAMDNEEKKLETVAAIIQLENLIWGAFDKEGFKPEDWRNNKEAQLDPLLYKLKEGIILVGNKYTYPIYMKTPWGKFSFAKGGCIITPARSNGRLHNNLLIHLKTGGVKLQTLSEVNGNYELAITAVAEKKLAFPLKEEGWEWCSSVNTQRTNEEWNQLINKVEGSGLIITIMDGAKTEAELN